MMSVSKITSFVLTPKGFFAYFALFLGNLSYNSIISPLHSSKSVYLSVFYENYRLATRFSSFSAIFVI